MYNRNDYRRIIRKSYVSESYEVYRGGEYSFFVERFTYRNGDVSLYAVRNGEVLHALYKEA